MRQRNWGQGESAVDRGLGGLGGGGRQRRERGTNRDRTESPLRAKKHCRQGQWKGKERN